MQADGATAASTGAAVDTAAVLVANGAKATVSAGVVVGVMAAAAVITMTEE